MKIAMYRANQLMVLQIVVACYKVKQIAMLLNEDQGLLLPLPMLQVFVNVGVVDDGLLLPVLGDVSAVAVHLFAADVRSVPVPRVQRATLRRLMCLKGKTGEKIIN